MSVVTELPAHRRRERALTAEAPAAIVGQIIFTPDQIAALGAAIAAHLPVAPAPVPAVEPNRPSYQALTVAEFCEENRISRSRFYTLLKAGKVKTIRLGKRGVRITADEAARFRSEECAA